MPSTRGRRGPFRPKKDGRETRTYVVRIKGREISLKTRDPDIANARAKEAYAGRRDWPRDDGREGNGTSAASVVAAALVGTGDIMPPVVEPAAPAAQGLTAGGPPTPSPSLPLAHTAPPALPPPSGSPGPETPASGAPGATEVHPDGYMPPPADWADRVAAAAAADGPKAEGTAPDLDPEFLDQMLGVCADVTVELQIGLQAWLIKRRAKLEAGAIPPDAKGREIGRQLWIAAFKKWFPSDLELPEWLLAPIMIAALTVPKQLQDGTPVRTQSAGRPDVGAVNPGEAAAA